MVLPPPLLAHFSTSETTPLVQSTYMMHLHVQKGRGGPLGKGVKMKLGWGGGVGVGKFWEQG